MSSYYGTLARSPRVQEQLLRDRLLRGRHEPDVEREIVKDYAPEIAAELQLNPDESVCDGIDDDCDGEIDELEFVQFIVVLFADELKTIALKLKYNVETSKNFKEGLKKITSNSITFIYIQSHIS